MSDKPTDKLQTHKPRINTLQSGISKVDLRQGAGVAVERIRGGRLVKIRERIAYRDRYKCKVCRRLVSNGEVDHIVPLYLGGQESDDNRQWLCPGCHKCKSDREEQERI